LQWRERDLPEVVLRHFTFWRNFMVQDSTSSSGSNYGSTTVAPATGTVAGSTTGMTPGSGMGGSTTGGTGSSASNSSSDRYLTGLFPDRTSAERAYQRSVDRGYKSDDINLVMSDDTRKRHFTEQGSLGSQETELGNKAAEGAGIGAGIGGTLGAIAAAVAAVGTSIALPGLGLVIAGPIAAALMGAGAGGAAGSLVGALIGWNIPEERVKEYEEGIKKGGILMGLRTRNDDDATELEHDWRGANGQAIYR